MTIGGNHTKIRNQGLGAKLPTGYLGDQMDKLGKKVGPKPVLGDINIVDQPPKEPRFKKAGPKGQYDRRILLSERGERIVEYHATKGWRSYRAA